MHVASLLLIAACAAVLGACGDREVTVQEPGLCPRVVVYGGVRYSALQRDWHDLRLAGGPALSARTGPCERDQQVRVWALAGIPPSVALAADKPLGAELFLAPGQLAVLPRHPLHNAAFGAADRPDLRTGRECARRAPVNGRASVSSALGQQVRVSISGRSPLTVRLDARTRVAGAPWLDARTRVRATLLQCADSNKPLARTISRQ